MIATAVARTTALAATTALVCSGLLVAAATAQAGTGGADCRDAGQVGHRLKSRIDLLNPGRYTWRKGRKMRLFGDLWCVNRDSTWEGNGNEPVTLWFKPDHSRRTIARALRSNAWGEIRSVVTLTSSGTWWITFAGDRFHSPAASPKVYIRVGVHGG